MEFHEKLQELRKEKGLTQEALAERLYVTRAAISKWESGRGYPNIESLKAISKFFSITVDELLSSDELLSIAEEDSRQRELHLRELTYSSLDLSTALFLFLPFFAEKTERAIVGVSLIALDGARPYLKIAYLAVVIALILMGVVTLLLKACRVRAFNKVIAPLSLILGVAAVLVFMVSAETYAAVFAFVLLTVKALVLIKRP